MIAAMIPHVAVVNSARLVLTGDYIAARRACCLLANFNSIAYDFVARQKVGGIHLNFFIANSFPPSPRPLRRCLPVAQAADAGTVDFRPGVEAHLHGPTICGHWARRRSGTGILPVSSLRTGRMPVPPGRMPVPLSTSGTPASGLELTDELMPRSSSSTASAAMTQLTSSAPSAGPPTATTKAACSARPTASRMPTTGWALASLPRIQVGWFRRPRHTAHGVCRLHRVPALPRSNAAGLAAW